MSDYAQAPAPSVPPGWKLVPVEPTTLMCEALVVEARFQYGFGSTIDSAVHLYRAMLAAAPQAPAPSVAQTEPETMPPIRTGGSLNIPDVVRRASRTAAPSVAQAELTFDSFRRANVARCIKWHPQGIDSWSPSDWLTAVTGELGELASLLKMRNRERDGLPGNKFSPTDKMVADEVADVLTYLDLLAEVLGVNLGAAAASKFNEVSERVGFPDRIELATPPSPAQGGADLPEPYGYIASTGGSNGADYVFEPAEVHGKQPRKGWWPVYSASDVRAHARAAQGGADEARLDWLDKHPYLVFGLGTTLYHRSDRGHRKFYTVRDAIDAAMTAPQGKEATP